MTSKHLLEKAQEHFSKYLVEIDDAAFEFDEDLNKSRDHFNQAMIIHESFKSAFETAMRAKQHEKALEEIESV